MIILAIICVGVIGIVISLTVPFKKHEQPKPNIVMIVADDLVNKLKMYKIGKRKVFNTGL